MPANGALMVMKAHIEPKTAKVAERSRNLGGLRSLLWRQPATIFKSSTKNPKL